MARRKTGTIKSRVKKAATQKARAYVKKKTGVNVKKKIPSPTKVVKRKATAKVKKAVGLKTTPIKTRARKNVRRAVRNVITTGKLSKRKVKQVYQGVENTDINKSTRTTLIPYIKDMASLIDEAYPTMNKSSIEAVERVRRIMGKGKNGELFNLALSSKKKSELLEFANLMKSIVEGDAVSAVGVIISNMRTYKAWETFRKSAKGFDVTFEEYNNVLLPALNEIKEVTELYGSKTVISLMSESGSRIGYTNVAKIIKNVKQQLDDEVIGKGFTTSEYQDLLMSRIQAQLKEAIGFTD